MRPILFATIFLALSTRAMQTGVTDSMPKLQSSRINNLLPLKAISILSLSASLLSRPAAAQAAVQAVVPLEVAKVATTSAVATATRSAITIGEEESVLNSFISGASTRVAKELVLHPIDTVRARLQRVPDSTGESVSQEGLFDNLYDGLLPALVGGVPAGALFFGIKDFSKQKLRKLGLGKAESTVLSVMVTNIPYWVVRTPSEVLKTKRQIRYDNGSSINEIMDTMIEQEGGVRQAIQSANGSYASNFAYALPADIVKFISYEALTSAVLGIKEGGKVEGLQAALTGAAASLIAQAVTTPLDVARTRIMIRAGDIKNQEEQQTEEMTNTDPFKEVKNIAESEGPGTLFAGLLPRAVRALTSGGIQFASYELTQNALLKR